MCRAVVLQIWHTYPGCQRFFLSLGATELSGEVAKGSREADKHYSLWRSLPLASEKTSGIQGTVLVALKILRDILSFTRSFMINTRPLVGCLENSDRKVKQFRVIPRIASSRFVYSSSIQCPKWMCLVPQRDSRFVSRKLSHNRHCADWTAWLEWLLYHLQW